MPVPRRPDQEHGGTVDLTIRVDRLVELDKASYYRSDPFNRLNRNDLIREAVAEYIENGDHWGDVDPEEVDA